MSREDFLPVIVGTDINTYNMLISFYEEYGISSLIVGRAPLPFTEYSNLPLTIEYDKNIGDTSKFAEILIRIAKKYQKSGRQLILIGTSDLYVRNIIENEKALKDYYVFNYPSQTLMDQLQYKAQFYELCEKYQIPYPHTAFYQVTDNQLEFNDDKMRYPLIVKPSNVIAYIATDFVGKQKVYRVENKTELLEVLKTLQKSAYRDEMIIQEYIPGDDTYMWDGVVYANQHQKVEMVALGQVILQEHTPTAIGNYTAIISRYNENLMAMMKEFIEKIGYTGYANFDLKYDERDQQFKVFEINIRQGRSSVYINALGQNLARNLVEDLIDKKEKPLTYVKGHHLFTVVPKKVLYDQVKNPEINQEVKELIKKRHWGNPLFYKKDTHLKRKFYLFLRQLNYIKKYKNNQW